MSKFDLTMLPPWEQLFKRVLWAQLGDLRGKRILDFGSGVGVTACHYAAENEVIAVEPSAESVAKRWDEHPYRQIVGSLEALRQMEDGSLWRCANCKVQSEKWKKRTETKFLK